ncbi:hypothetical protein LAZ67_9002198 [Cordylochernes scorpioides]|uniref:Reverse transcriptase domain-containing protein n=1 Tax=Cordylochernes scorpioides TaxID=51811 RepID=A0ABY6KWE1_9ARAC|nr:hypothetical protein LAZ67_9002198 [Cordylochernes scorpioides]
MQLENEISRRQKSTSLTSAFLRFSLRSKSSRSSLGHMQLVWKKCHRGASSTKMVCKFQKHWSSSTLPKEWKHVTIIPIHKPGKLENHPTNYRPISLTSIPCKIMEHLILNRLTFYLNLNNLLDPNQRAFKKYKTTEDSIFYFVQQIQDTFHHKPTKSTIIAFIDLSQAFDRVWKEKLILKLDELGIEGSMLIWIRNFLSNAPYRLTSTTSNQKPLVFTKVYPKDQS